MVQNFPSIFRSSKHALCKQANQWHSIIRLTNKNTVDFNHVTTKVVLQWQSTLEMKRMLVVVVLVVRYKIFSRPSILFLHRGCVCVLASFCYEVTGHLCFGTNALVNKTVTVIVLCLVEQAEAWMNTMTE